MPRPAGGGDRVLVDAHEGVGGVLPAHLRRALDRALAHPAGPVRVVDDLEDGVGPDLGVVRVEQDAAVADGVGQPAAPGGDDQPWVYAGTLAVGGHGIAEVAAIGVATQAGRIGLSLATIEQVPTLLQQTVGRLVRLFGGIALAVSALLLVLYGLLRGDWLEGTLAAIALAMAMLPEEFPMALAVFLALGAWRLAQVQVLVRRPAVVETLGAASVLCVDKTGTLTENHMRVRALVAGGATFELAGAAARALPEAFHRVLEYGVLASKRRAVDPMDRAAATLGDLARDGIPFTTIDALSDQVDLGP